MFNESSDVQDKYARVFVPPKFFNLVQWLRVSLGPKIIKHFTAVIYECS